MRLKAILKEPVLHFLLIGVALFLYFQWSGAGSAFGRPRIVVTSGQVEYLAAAYTKAWHRPPAENELQGLIDDWIREEIAVREAMSSGLDRGDSIIRRRLRQRFEVIAEERDAGGAPSEADLAAYLAQHPDRFTTAATVSFDQTLGRASMLPDHVDSMRMDLVARTFGTGFADQLAKLPPNEWSGPLRSPFGSHVVRVTAYAPGALAPLEEVRTAVAREWENERRVTARAEAYRNARARYEIVLEPKLPRSDAVK